MPSVTAFVADMTTISERPKAMGLVSAAISGGFIIGPGWWFYCLFRYSRSIFAAAFWRLLVLF